MATYRGTAGSDTLVLGPEALSGARVLLGGGYDTLSLSGSGSYAFDRSSYWQMKGVDALDFSLWSGSGLSVELHNSMLRRSDNAHLDIISGEMGINSLYAPAFSSGSVSISGDGLVQLADGVVNVVSITSGASVSVAGGTGDDTITSGSTGNTLDGGAGNDTLVAGAGADTIAFSAGYGADTVTGFDTTSDTIALTGIGFTTYAEITNLLSAAPDGSARLTLSAGDRLTLTGVAVEDLTAANFTSDGAPVTSSPPVIMVAVGTSASEINALITSAEEGTTIVLQDGHHVFDEGLIIDRDGITLRGESEAGTLLTFAFAPGEESDGITVNAGAKTWLGTSALGLVEGGTTIELPANHGLIAGDALYIYQGNTPEWLAANGWDNVAWEDADERPFREAIVRIAAIDGDTATLLDPLPYDMDAGAAKLFAIDLVQDVTISDMTLAYDLGTPNTYDFVNTLPDYSGNNAIHVEGADSAALARLSILDAPSTGIRITSSIGVTGDDILVDGAHNKGGGGNGYGLTLYETFNSSFTGLELFNGRHAFVLSAWNAETGNDIHILSTNRDINFHGSPDHGNSITVDFAALDYDPSQDTSGANSVWALVSDGGASFAATDIYGANSVVFDHALGSDRNEEIHGSDGGAYLNAGFGYDTLVGGDGNDVLVGGLRKDTMTGGAGSDTFVLRVGDDLDTITDFEFDPGGDLLVFSNNPAVTSVDDLVITAVGNDTQIRYGSNATVILETTAPSDIDPNSFTFDPDGSAWATAWTGDDTPFA